MGGGAHHDGRDAGRLRGGRRSRCSCVVDRHHDRRGERRSSSPSFPLTFPTMFPNANRQSPLWTLGKTLTYLLRGERDPDVPPIAQRLVSAKYTSPSHGPRPLLECHLRTLPCLTFQSCVPGAPCCGCSESSRLAQRHPKVFIRYSDVGHGGCDSLARFPVRNSFPECNTPLISAHGALSSTPCC